MNITRAARWLAWATALLVTVTLAQTPGSFDTTFNGTGRRTIHLTNHDNAFSVAVQPDGRIVAAGGCHAIVGITRRPRIALGLTGSAALNAIGFAPHATRTTWSAIRDHLVTQCGMSLP